MTTTSDIQVATPARRVVVVSAQRETESGIELLALCQPVTAGGWLSDAEIASLRAWLDARREEQASPYARLFPVVADCIASGRVTRDACRTLFNAIAAVLPTEVRAIARSSRRSLEEKDAERYKLERDAHWQQPRDERERNRPIARLEFMAAGTREEGRPAVIERFARRGDPVFLVRDPGNVRSGHTIQVRVAGGMQLGFVPEEIASDIARLLDAGCPLEAEIATMLSGERHPVPVLTVTIYRSDSTVVDMVQPDEPLRSAAALPAAHPAQSGTDWGALWQILLAIVAAFVLYRLLR